MLRVKERKSEGKRRVIGKEKGGKGNQKLKERKEGKRREESKHEKERRGKSKRMKMMEVIGRNRARQIRGRLRTKIEGRKWKRRTRRRVRK